VRQGGGDGVSIVVALPASPAEGLVGLSGQPVKDTADTQQPWLPHPRPPQYPEQASDDVTAVTTGTRHEEAGPWARVVARPSVAPSASILVFLDLQTGTAGSLFEAHHADRADLRTLGVVRSAEAATCQERGEG
jgi:hypothetical protein